MQRILGIDLGTTNSVAAYMTKGAPKSIGSMPQDAILPSIINISPKGTIRFGASKDRNSNSIYSAKRFIGRRFDDELVKRALQTMKFSYGVKEGLDGTTRLTIAGKEFSPTEVSAMVLRRLKEKAEELEQCEFNRAVISVPAYFGERNVAATREAGRLAGFQVVQIVHEPTAAALAYSVDHPQINEPKIVAVYDLGGGTFDISLLQTGSTPTVLKIGGDLFLGGDNFDQLVFDFVIDQMKRTKGVSINLSPQIDRERGTLASLMVAAEAAKIELSTAQNTDIELSLLNDEVDVYVSITRRQFEQMIEPLIDRSIAITKQTIEAAGLSLNDVEMVLPVGGSSQIPLVQRKLVEFFGERKVQRMVNPMLCVGVGAAVQSALITEIACEACMTSNDIALDTCKQCKHPLYGDEAPIVKLMGAVASAGDQRLKVVTPAPLVSLEETGLKCNQCGALNKPGALTCAKCGAEMALQQTVDIVPHSIGIELQDGRFSIIVPEGTPFPFPHKTRTYYTSAAGQERLEINVYEGEDTNSAANNALVGTINIILTENYRKGTPIDVGIGMDHSRNLDLRVQVNPPAGEEKRITLQRDRLRPELIGRVSLMRDKVVKLLDRFRIELTPAELHEITRVLEQADQLITGTSAARITPQQFEDELSEMDRIVDDCIDVRGTSAILSHILGRGEGLLLPDKHRVFLSLNDRLDHARRNADWITGLNISREVDAAINELGATMAVIRAEMYADDTSLSPSLRNRLASSTREIRSGLQQGSDQKIENGFTTMYGLWDEIKTEMNQQGREAIPLVKPQDHA